MFKAFGWAAFKTKQMNAANSDWLNTNHLEDETLPFERRVDLEIYQAFLNYQLIQKQAEDLKKSQKQLALSSERLRKAVGKSTSENPIAFTVIEKGQKRLYLAYYKEDEETLTFDWCPDFREYDLVSQALEAKSTEY